MPPKIQATRSNLARPTRPQFSPPTSTSVAATTSSFFIFVHLLYRNCPGESIARFRDCQTLVEVLYIHGMTETGGLRIGELSRRSGVSRELLRAWERRYGLLRPARSPGGLRLYSDDDLGRVQAMQQNLAEGFAAAEAAALAVRPAR